MKYAIFLDYDNVDYEELKGRVVGLSRRFGLGSAQIWLSSSARPPFRWNPHYHVVFEKRVSSPEEVREVVKESKCCEDFTRYAMRYDVEVLRLVASAYKEEPQLLEVVE